MHPTTSESSERNILKSSAWLAYLSRRMRIAVRLINARWKKFSAIELKCSLTRARSFEPRLWRNAVQKEFTKESKSKERHVPAGW